MNFPLLGLTLREFGAGLGLGLVNFVFCFWFLLFELELVNILIICKNFNIL